MQKRRAHVPHDNASQKEIAYESIHNSNAKEPNHPSQTKPIHYTEIFASVRATSEFTIRKMKSCKSAKQG